MKKTTLTLLLVMIFAISFAPVGEAKNQNDCSHETNKRVNDFKELIYAIGYVETRLDTFAYCEEENAVGYFQIRQIRIDDYNWRTGKSYELSEMYDYDKAEEVFLYYAKRIGKDRPDLIAKRWNGSGPMTVTYWEKVSAVLNENNLQKL